MGSTARTTTKQRMRKAPDHPLAPPCGMLAVSRITLYDAIGPGEHKCHWCGATVRWLAGAGPGGDGALLVDHIDWNRRNDEVTNLVPSCNRCNSHRLHSGTRRVITDEDLTMVWGGVVTRAVQRYCAVCGTQFLTIPAELRKGKGRYCSRSCARRADHQLR